MYLEFGECWIEFDAYEMMSVVYCYFHSLHSSCSELVEYLSSSFRAGQPLLPWLGSSHI